MSDRAAARWNALLGRVVARGGTAAEEHTFYTALYHSLLFPNIVSDVNGQYAGSDGRVHTAHGRDEYANFSEWDIYRSDVQLESLLAPHDVGDMVQSLVDDAQQTGWLPKWAVVGGDESQINGDSADPIIADAYAMGVRNFDVTAALKAMVKGATQTETGHGLEIERQYLSQYLSQHYVNAGSLDLTSIDYSIGGSVTLEYAIDDSSIARIASALGDSALASSMRRRAANWEYLFNPATGYIQARGNDGSFPPGPAFEASQLEPGGQLGFEEGNAVQYTWSVPQDLAALASLMGGDAAATSELTTFFTSLNASRDAPYDWSGNEPGEWAPWEFDSFGAPDKTQGTVRAIVNTEYADAPVDEPGNDDLGAISSWYVWAALGFFPVTPGSANLALASPLFPSVTLTLPDGRRLVEHAPGAAASRPFVHALTVAGVSQPAPTPSGTRCAQSSTAGHGAPSRGWDRTWLPASVLRTGASPVLHTVAQPGPDLGVVGGRRPAFVRHRGAPRGRVLVAERRDLGGRRTGDRHPGRRGRRRDGTDHGPLAGDIASERARGVPAVGNADTRPRLRDPPPGHPVTDRQRRRPGDLPPSRGDGHFRGSGAPSGRPGRRGASLSRPARGLLVRDGDRDGDTEDELARRDGSAERRPAPRAGVPDAGEGLRGRLYLICACSRWRAVSSKVIR